jgi:ABC-2 type transport system ATP-binding protein
VWQLSTSDDDRALATAAALSEVKAAYDDAGVLAVQATQDRMDDYVVALGVAGVAVRAMELDATPLEALFFQLTAPGR